MLIENKVLLIFGKEGMDGAETISCYGVKYKYLFLPRVVKLTIIINLAIGWGAPWFLQSWAQRSEIKERQLCSASFWYVQTACRIESIRWGFKSAKRNDVPQELCPMGPDVPNIRFHCPLGALL